MTVGIDVSQLSFPGTGVAKYTKNLVENILIADHDNEYKLFGSSLRQQKQFDILPNVKRFAFPPTILEFLWNSLHTLPVEKLIGSIDIFHSSDWTQPPTSAKKVTTIHDMVVYKYPETSHPKIIAAEKRRLNWVKKECDAIIAVSESTKKDVIQILDIPEEKIKVIYEATNITKSTIKTEGKPFILAVGTREPRKNIDRLVQAFLKIKNKDLDLIIAGNYGWGGTKITHLSKVRSNIKLLGFVTDNNLAELYSNASAFVYPSLYEGFGLPVLEAFSCDCPVITSNVSSLPEVGGSAAIYVDPLSVSDIAEKIDWILSLSHGKKSEIIKAGRKQVEQFSWAKAAKETIRVYEELA